MDIAAQTKLETQMLPIFLSVAVNARKIEDSGGGARQCRLSLSGTRAKKVGNH